MALYFSWREARILAVPDLPVILADLPQTGMKHAAAAMGGSPRAAEPICLRRVCGQPVTELCVL